MIIITGGSGFIGSCLISRLNSVGFDDIIVVDNFNTTLKWKNLVGKKFRELIERDHAFEYLSSLQESPKAVVHLGACSSPAQTDFGYLLRNNLHFSQRIALLSQEWGAKLVYASSAGTYGMGESGFVDGFDNLDQFYPVSGYGFSKHEFDRWIVNNNLQQTVTGLKFFNVFGPNEYHKDNMISPVLRFYRQLKQVNEVSLLRSYHPDYQDGEQKRDFVSVLDCVEVIIWALNNLEFSSSPATTTKTAGLFNVGTGQASSWQRVAESVAKAAKLDLKVRFLEMDAQMRSRYQYFTQADLGKLRAAGYLRDFTPLEEAIAWYVRGFLLADEPTYF